jgi:hypothetical protein
MKRTRAHVIMFGMAVSLAGCAAPAQRASEGQCFRVRYDAGGRRAVIAGRSIQRVSETRVTIKDVVSINGTARSQKSMDITSTNIAIDEGSCYLLN